jgi:hypothetical protein
MSACTDQKQNHTFRIFQPDKKKVIHYMAFIAILVIATKLMGFMFFMDSGKSCLGQFFNKAFKDFKILLGTLFQQFQVFFELPSILNCKHLNTIKKGFNAISFINLSFLGILNGFACNLIGCFFNPDKVIVAGIIPQKLHKVLSFLALIININKICCHSSIFLQKYKIKPTY